MSDPSVYRDDMSEKFIEQEAERIFSGHAPESEEMAAVAALMAAMRTRYLKTPSDETVDRVAASYAAAARDARPNATSQSPASIGVFAPLRRTRRRLVTASAAAVLFAGMTGVALAANEAAPGDVLYGLDRVVEKIGIGAGGPPERIAEAQALFAAGDAAAAVEHAAEAADEASDNGDAEAVDALMRAADSLRVIEQGSDHANEVRNRVADMLDWMADHDPTGPDFGHGVAEMARGISKEDEAEDAAQSAAEIAKGAAERAAEKAGGGGGPPEGVPGGPPAGVPGGP